MRSQHCVEWKSGGFSDFMEVIRGGVVADHLVRGAIDQRTVQDAVPHTRRFDTLGRFQVVRWNDVVVVDPLLGHQLSGDDGLAMEVARCERG